MKSLTLHEKLTVLRKSKQLEIDKVYEKIAFSTSESIYEGKIWAGFLNFLKNLKSQKKFELLHNTINEFLGEDIKDINFVKWLAEKNSHETSKKLLEAFSN